MANIFKKIGKSVTTAWKDLWDPGRHERGKLEALYAEEAAREKEYQQRIAEQQQNLTKHAELSNAQNKAWAEAYLNRLKESPDLAYNQGVSALERGLTDSRTNLANAMARRGIGGSGIDIGALSGSNALRARGISALQGQRIHDQLDSGARALNVVGGVNTDAMNMLQSAYGFGKGTGGNSNILSSYINYLQQGANAPSMGGELLRTYLGGSAGGIPSNQRAQLSGIDTGSGFNPSLNDLEFMLRGAY